jgi:uroporphyrinogen-III synthase
LHLTPLAWKACRLASIGPWTSQALLRHGQRPTQESGEASSQGLLAFFEKQAIRNAEILLPRSDLAGPALVEGLTRLGNRVTPLVLYHTRCPEPLPAIDWTDVGEVVFTSPSGVMNFQKHYGPVPAGVRCTAIGPETRRALQHAQI